MKNPWLHLPNKRPRVLATDRPVIDAFNAKYDGSSYQIQTQLYPEPYVGNRNAAVYLLGLNPGYSPEDEKLHKQRAFRKAIVSNLRHERSITPFYYLDERFDESPSAKWCRQRMRWLIEEAGIECLSKQLFLVELFPYHSKRYKQIPKSISDSGFVPSSEYSAYLVRKAIAEKKHIIAMRAFSAWSCLVPELESYRRLHRLNSTVVSRQRFQTSC